MEISFTRVALLAAALFFVGCDQKPQPAKSHATEVTVLEGKTMGTFWRASIPGIDAKRSAELKEKIQTQLDADDQLLSTYKKDSALMRFNDSQSLSPWPVSEAMADIVTTSLRIGAKTDGAMDITVGPLVNLWGFGPEQQPVQIPSQEQIDAMKAKTGLQHLTVINQSHQQYLQKDLPDLYVDLSTVGEGYAADHLARLMEQEGISRYLVSVGGALNSRGMNGEGLPWRVAIQKPTDKENAVQAVVDINGHGISTSGSYRNYYELDGKRLSHVIDPQTGRPIEHNLVSVTVIAPTAVGPQYWGTGGEMEMWRSHNRGKSWELVRQLTHNSLRNHSYARRPLHAHPDFYAFWADGNPERLSISYLYFCNDRGDVFRMPYTMEHEWQKPEPVIDGRPLD